MMRRATIALTTAALLSTGSAKARTPALSEGIHFRLKPQPLTLVRDGDSIERARINMLDPVPRDDREHELAIMVRRQKARPLREQNDRASPSSFNPRSRLILLTVEDRAPLNDLVTVAAGFQGVKLSNRDANVTALGGNARLRTRDWFVPHATIEICPAPSLDVAIGYRETLRAYGETGVAGPMGLTHEAFRTLASRLRPETHNRIRMEAGWKPSPDLTLGISAYRGRIDHRLSFADRTYLPLNSGSAGLEGVSVALNHRLTRHWRWSMRYGQARLREAEGVRAQENSMTLTTGWTSGPWSTTLQGTKSGAPALVGNVGRWSPRVRFEGELRYRLPGIGRAPASLSLRLTDPDRLASTALLRDEPAGPVRAADQARGLMLDIGLGW
ncbi:MAG TPA: hypothetical protein VJM09_06495 [Sphingobium sp.]|nr:hypothetical protein [Sphingobium sp.]